jgi:hypothetical protein
MSKKKATRTAGLSITSVLRALQEKMNQEARRIHEESGGVEPKDCFRLTACCCTSCSDFEGEIKIKVNRQEDILASASLHVYLSERIGWIRIVIDDDNRQPDVVGNFLFRLDETSQVIFNT